MVLTIEIAYQLVAPWISLTVVGSIVSDTSMLELSPTVTALVLAGRVGSNISAEIGNMKISEQIDALEVMGINSANYLIFPKIIASLISIPLLIIISIALSQVGGLWAGHILNIVSVQDFVEGARASFKTFTLIYAIIKAFTFAFIISSISSYQGYFVVGGSVEVSKASTRAVVQSCIFILIFDYLLALLLL
jgi:phospholipid/cholesterol/gamma-HCH transport system permease protein